MHSLVGSTSAATSQQGDWLLSLLLAWQRRSLCIQLHFCVAAAGVEKLQRQVQCAKKNQGVAVKKHEKNKKRPAATPTWLGGALLAFCLLWMFPPKVRCICSAAKLRVCRGLYVCVSFCVCVCAAYRFYQLLHLHLIAFSFLIIFLCVCFSSIFMCAHLKFTRSLYHLPLPFPYFVYFTKFSLKPATCEKLFARSCIWDATRSFSLLT